MNGKVKKARHRWKRCYELCCEILLKEDGWEEVKLVHGTVGRIRIPHAWLELPDGSG
jgi:hypothetical protein